MSKRKGRLQEMIDRERIEEDTAPLVNEFASQHGDYERNLRFVRNRGGTTIDRWIAAKQLTESQCAGILHCQRLWHKIGSRSVVVDFNRVRGLPHGDGYSQHEALTELGRIAGTFPREYWDVYENICRFDLPAGTAGSHLARNKRSSLDAARTIVAFIADMIAWRERLSY
jgi:hypothetical protein